MRKLLSFYLIIYNKIKRELYSPEKYAISIGVTIGKGCHISTKSFSSEPYLIKIGDYVRIAKDVLLLTHGGIWSIRKKYPELKDLDYFGKITIGDYTYIGERAIIMPGVEIGKNCVIGAASVVTKSVPDNCIVAGNPIRYLGRTSDFADKIKLLNTRLKLNNETSKKDELLSLSEDKFIKKPIINIPAE